MKKAIVIILTCALLLAIFAGCSGEGEKKIILGGKAYTEAQLTAEIMAQLIEQGSDIKVERKYDMSGAICFEALKNGEIDMYPEYTGGMVMAYLNEEIEPGTSPEETYRRAKEGFASKFNLVVLESMGFNNTYANAIKTEYADAHGLVTNSDLAAFTSGLTYGAEHAFYDRLDGYHNMCDTYGFQFKSFFMIDVSLKQQSIKQGEFDVTNVYTTDGWLDGSGLTLLEDDLNFFPAYYCCPVIRQDTLDKYPEIKEILSVLKDCCTEEDMIYYNNLVDDKGMSIANAASQFIEDKGLQK